MGGINHQPCSSFLPNSTRLSRALSLAVAQLELGNVELEDVILADLEGRKIPLDGFLGQLEKSLLALGEMDKAAVALKEQMDESSFQDLPTLRTVDLAQTGKAFERAGMINLESWEKMSQIMRRDGFYGVIRWFRKTIAELQTHTRQLIQTVQGLQRGIETVSVAAILEENRAGNIRPDFAKVYTAWGDFHRCFLASSLISTELWYRFNSFGSLAEETAHAKVA